MNQPPQWGPPQGYGPPTQQQGYGPPVVYAAPMPFFGCLQCGYQGQMTYATKMSGGGWFVFLILLVLFFPLCWIGLLIRVKAQRCPRCHNVHGNWA